MPAAAKAHAPAKAAPKKVQSLSLANQPGQQTMPGQTGYMPMLGPRLAGCACGGGCPRCRSATPNPLLTLSRGHRQDHFEREARRVAASLGPTGAPVATPRTRRVPISPAASLFHSDAGVILPTSLRQRLEPQLGIDLSLVRLHVGAESDRAVRQLGARAFTHGNHVYFRNDTFAPETTAGMSLLAHELVHVLQQSVSRSVPQLQCEDGTDADAFHGLHITTRNRVTLAHDIRTIMGNMHLHFSRYVVVTSQIYSYDEAGTLLGSVGLRRGFRPAPGIYAIGSDGNFLLGTRGEQMAWSDVGFSTADMSAEFRERTGSSQLIEMSTWTTATAEQASNLFTMPFVMIVAPPAPPSPPPPAEPPAAEEPPAPAPTPAEESHDADEDRPTFGTDFHDPANPAGRTYAFPAFPARIDGLDTQPVGGTGDFSMVLDYSAAGGDVMYQASWAFQTTRYRWELWKLRPELDPAVQAEAVRTGALATGATAEEGRTTGALEGTARDWERTDATLRDRRAEIARDEREALAEGRYLDVLAGELNTELYSLEQVSHYASQLLDTMGDIWARESERRIPWTEAGTYVVRCLAVINPDASAEENARAPSVATKIIRVEPAAQIAEEALDTTGETLDLLTGELGLLRRLPADDPRRLRIPTLEEQIGILQLDTRDASIELIEERYRIADRAASEARSTSLFIEYGLGDDRVRALESARDHLAAQLAHARERTGVLTRTGDTPRRARAVLISNITGEQYPLILLVNTPYLDGHTWKCDLADVTSSDGNSYTGEAPDDPANQERQKTLAAWEAVERFIHAAPYGPGSLTVRMPTGGTVETNWFVSLAAADRQRTQEVTNARDLAAARARLEELGTALALLGLLIAAPEIGIAGAALGAAVSADRLIQRYLNGTLHRDAAAIGDVINILAAFATGVQLVGRLERFAPLAVETLASGERVTIGSNGFGARLVRGAASLAHAAETGLDYANLLLANSGTIEEFIRISQAERDGTMTAAQARRARAHAFASAVEANGLFLASRVQAAYLDPHAGGTRPHEEGGSVTISEPPVAGGDDTPPPAGTRPGEHHESGSTPGPDPEPGATRPAPSTPEGTETTTPHGETPETTTPHTPSGEEGSGGTRVTPPDAPPSPAGEHEPTVMHMPEATVMISDNPHSIVDADRMYQNSWHGPDGDSGREVAIYHNPEHDMYVVVQGDSQTVFVIEADGTHAALGANSAHEWTELLGGTGSGRWELLAHFHPDDPATGAAHPTSHLPSGGTGDFAAIIGESLRSGGGPRHSRIDFNTPTGPGHTFFHFDPASARPYHIDYPNPTTGAREHIDFATLQEYHNWFHNEYGGNLGTVPDWVAHWESNRATTPPPPPATSGTPPTTTIPEGSAPPVAEPLPPAPVTPEAPTRERPPRDTSPATTAETPPAPDVEPPAPAIPLTPAETARTPVPVRRIIRPDRETRPRSDSGSEATPEPATGGTSPARPTTRRGPRRSGTRAPVGLQTADGQLTDAGVNHIRRSFPDATRGLTDEQVRQRYANQPNWLESVVRRELRNRWRGAETATDFLLAERDRNFRYYSDRIAAAAVAAGIAYDPAILSHAAATFLRDAFQAGHPTVTAQLHACLDAAGLGHTPADLETLFSFSSEDSRGSRASLAHPDPAVRAFRERFAEFAWRQAEVQGEHVHGTQNGFLLLELGALRPDFIELELSQGRARVTDATMDFNNPIHNLKTAVYQAIIESLLPGVHISASDYRSLGRQTVVAP